MTKYLILAAIITTTIWATPAKAERESLEFCQRMEAREMEPAPYRGSPQAKAGDTYRFCIRQETNAVNKMRLLIDNKWVTPQEAWACVEKWRGMRDWPAVYTNACIEQAARMRHAGAVD